MRYFIGFLVTVGLIVLIVVLLFSGNNAPTTPKVDLLSYENTDATVEMINSGPITAELTHNEVKIDITRNQATLTVYQGYQETVVSSQSYANNQSAFSALLHALDVSGFTKGDPDKAKADERGYCIYGNRYVYSLISDGNVIQRYWSTSCTGIRGTYEGNRAATIWLFQKQIPDYAKLTTNVAI